MKSSILSLEAIAETGESPEDKHREELRAKWEGLKGRLFDIEKPPPPLKPIVKLRDIPIATAGNLIPVTGQAKTAKTRIAEAIIASAMAKDPADIDTLGFKALNPEGKAVIYIDGEQSAQHFHRLVQSAMERAKVQRPPEWLYPFHMTGLSPADIRAAFLVILETVANRHGGILFSFADGVTDFMRKPNDEDESIEITTWFHGLAIKYDTSFFGVIHNNAGSDNSKMRGHIGSQWERKGETVLRCKKDPESVVTVYADIARTQTIPESQGARFQWSDEAAMFLSVDSKATIQADRRAVQKSQLVEAALGSDTSIQHKDLVTRIADHAGCSEAAAKKRISRLRDEGFLKVQSATGFYYKGELV